MKKILVTAVFIIGFAAYVLYVNKGMVADEDMPQTSLTVGDQSAAGSTTTVTTHPTPSIAPASQPTSTPTKPIKTTTGTYKDGTYSGSYASSYYGGIQVSAVISGGKLADVLFLKYPTDRNTSKFINLNAMPTLKAEAIQAQSANINGVSGASDSSAAFKESLSVALAAAQN